MRLIDADKIIDSLGNSDMDFAIGVVIDEQPTAFDLDKVMEQLKDRSVLSRPVGWPKIYEIITLEDAIEIVKGGGVE